MKENKKMKKWQIASALVVGAVVVVGGVMVGSGVGTQGMLSKRVSAPVAKVPVALKYEATNINKLVKIGGSEMPTRISSTTSTSTTTSAKYKIPELRLAAKGELSKGEFSNLLIKELGINASKNTGCAEDLKGSAYEQSACYLVKSGIMNLDTNGKFNSGEMVSKREFSDKMVKVFNDPQCPWCSMDDNNTGLIKEMVTYATSELDNSSTAIGSEKASIIMSSVINGVDSKGVKVCCLMN